MSENLTNSSDDISPLDWFYFDDNAPEELHYWPWYHVTINQWKTFIQRTSYISYYKDKQMNVNYFFMAVGFLGTVLTCLTVINLPKKSLNSFYMTMLAEAVLEGSFLFLKVTRQELSKSKLSSALAVGYYVFASGTVYTCSLMSDMLTLALTIERYVALAAPVFHKGLTSTVKRRAWYLAISVSAAVASTRVHYAFVNYYYRNDYIAAQSWFLAVCYISDTVVPFFLTAVMVFLVLGVLRVIWTRYRQRMSKEAIKLANGQEKRESDQEMKMISLLAALLFAFFMNQIGYILYDISVKVYDKYKGITYESSFDEVNGYMVAYEFYNIAAQLSGCFEIATRSLPFYLYMLFNARFRADFVKLLNRCGLYKGNQVNPMQTAVTNSKMAGSSFTRVSSNQMRLTEVGG